MQIEIRNASLPDVARMAEVERRSWPEGLAAGEEQLARRIETFPQGQWVAVREGEIVGVAGGQRLSEAFFQRAEKRYEVLTDSGTFERTHDPAGEIYHLVGVAVAPECRGANVARRLVDREVAVARALGGVRRILGFTRPVGYHKRPELSAREYAELRDAKDRPLDPVLAFHLEAGARLVALYEDYRPGDEETLGWGALIEYPV